MSEIVQNDEARKQELERIKKWIEERRKAMENGQSAKPGEEPSKEAKAEYDEGRTRFTKLFACWPDHVKAHWMKESQSMKGFASGDKHYVQTKRYLDMFIQVPWGQEENRNVDIKEVRRSLEESHYGMDPVKQRILELLAVQRLSGTQKGQVLLLSGPPGVGKSSFARGIAKSLGKSFYKIPMGGMSDDLYLKGCDRTYANAFPGSIVRALINSGSLSPVILLDEIDKVSMATSKGDCGSILLDILDSCRSEFVDSYIQLPIDLSKVLFICTANYPDQISPPLLDRMEHIRLPGYSQDEKLEIAGRYVIPRKLEETGLNTVGYSFSPEAVTMIVEACSTSPGVREIERLIEGVCRRVALMHLMEGLEDTCIDCDFVMEQQMLPSIAKPKPKARRIGFMIEEEVEN